MELLLYREGVSPAFERHPRTNEHIHYAVTTTISTKTETTNKRNLMYISPPEEEEIGRK
jgi:hypothetical protein